MPTWRQLLSTRPDLRRLWLAGAISMIGDWLSLVAVSIATLRSGGAVALGISYALHQLPSTLLSPFAGVLADRFDRRTLMLLGNLVQAALTVLLLLAVRHGSIPFIQLVLLARGAASAFVVPAESAALPRLVPPEEILPANGLLAATWSVSYCAGMALGGALVALGPSIALGLDALSFVLAGAIVMRLPSMPIDAVPLEDTESFTPTRRQSWWRDLGDAWRYAGRRAGLRTAVLAKVPVAIAGGAGWLTLNLNAGSLTLVQNAAVALGMLQAVRGAGTGIGPLIAAKLQARGAGRGLMAVSTATAFLGIALCNVVSPGWLLLAVTLLWGMGTGANWVLSSSEIQRLSHDRFLGRLSAIDNVVSTGAFCLFALAGGFVCDATGEQTSSAWVGLGAAVLSLPLLRLASRDRGVPATVDTTVTSTNEQALE